MKAMEQQHGENWSLYQGDSCELMRGLPTRSIDLAVFSPPFKSLYTYSNSERDLGNCRGDTEFFAHFGYITQELRRVLRPGRLACVHVQQLTTTQNTHGVIGLTDFRGDVIRHFTAGGWVFHGEVTIDKCPQAQAIRTKSKSLMFVQKNRDRSWLRPALADYILLFRAPGDNPTPICDGPNGEVSNEDWIGWARPIWYGIRETETLNVAVARDNEDERHVCPLQLGTIERCVKLWSNPGETVLSPFAGIGSEGYVALQHGRRFLGIELKPSYYRVAGVNLRQAERLAQARTLFSDSEPAAVAPR